MDLIKACESILRQNWRDGYTVPSPKLYPFQWNWDSGFIALGYLHLDPDKAFQEMERLFLGQWGNGFLPHIVFHHAEKYGNDYFPSADYWNSNVSDQAPRGLKTTGITQPPVHGYILERMYQKLGISDRLLTLFDQVVRYHQYLYEARETLDNGLVAIWHNWESGMDNSPWWDESLQRIDPSALQHIALNRKDVKAVEHAEQTRPTDEEYRRYLWLVNTLKDHQYASCPNDYPFQMLDLTFNSLLIASTQSLLRVGAKMGRNMATLEAKMTLGIESFNQLMWDEADGCYYPYDLVSKSQVKLLGAACFLPLFAGIPNPEQAGKLSRKLDKYQNVYGIPSLDPGHAQFEEKKYWRGPVWVNMNYMIWKGLDQYGLHDASDRLKEKTLEMVKKYGLREYYSMDPAAEEGYGAEDFSWSASLILDHFKQ